MQANRITGDRIKNHFHYSWWKYVILAAITIMGWNIIFSATIYTPPADKKLGVYFATYSIDSQNTAKLREMILEHDKNLEDATVTSITYTDSDNYYGSMQLTTYMGSGEGDIYIVDRSIFEKLEDGGGFVMMDEPIATGRVNLQGVDASSCFGTDDEGISGIMGVPLSELYGLLELGIDNRDLVLLVMGFSGNQEGAMDFINWLFAEMKTEKPEWLVEYEAKLAEEEAKKQQQIGTVDTQGVSEIPSY